MATKPTKLPAWNTGLTNNSEPTSLKKIEGWVPGEDVPAQWLNWLFALIHDWIAYLNDLGSQVIAWTAAHTWTSSANVSLVTITGAGSGSGAAPLRVVSSGSSPFSNATAAYLETNKGLDTTLSLNAKLGGSAMFAQGGLGTTTPVLRVQHLAKASNNAVAALDATGAIKLSGSTLATTPLPNSIVALTLPRAWGFIRYTDSWDLEDGANIASVAVSGSALRVTLASTMDSEWYAVQANYSVIGTTGVFPYIVSVGNITSSYFEIVACNTSGIQVNIGSLTTSTLGFSFVVFGRQAGA
jgi:hypothetical protein